MPRDLKDRLRGLVRRGRPESEPVGSQPATSRSPDPEPADSPPPVQEEEAPAKPEWEYIPEGWSRVDQDERIAGWNVADVARAHRANWGSFRAAVDGSGPLGVYHEVPAGAPVGREDPEAQNMVMSFGYALALAAHHKDRVSVLDWGGAVGHYYVLAKALLPDVEVDYHCKEVPALCTEGRALLPEVRFYEDDPPTLPYDLVVASGSLQYSRDWAATLGFLAGTTSGYLFVSRLPIARKAPPFVVLQRAYAYGYGTEYAGWVLNRDELLLAARSAGVELMREFVSGAWFAVPGAPEETIAHRGFLFRPT
jgi:putative methyltransferase (TIGR04325 family)